MFAAMLLDLTFAEVIGDLPHDTGAIIAYLLLTLFIGFVWHGSRKKPQGVSELAMSVGGSQAPAGTHPAD